MARVPPRSHAPHSDRHHIIIAPVSRMLVEFTVNTGHLPDIAILRAIQPGLQSSASGPRRHSSNQEYCRKCAARGASWLLRHLRDA